jgi:hypothetical protein
VEQQTLEQILDLLHMPPGPRLPAMEDLLAFCSRYEKVYVCGAGRNSVYLHKILKSCGVDAAGFAVSQPERGEQDGTPVVALGRVPETPGAGLVLGLGDIYYHEILPILRGKGFVDYYPLAECDKQEIAKKFEPKPREKLTFEITVADHCNLSCLSCDHFSQLADPWTVPVETFAEDAARMGELLGHKSGAIQLIGGEPLLHPRLPDLGRILRAEFPDSVLLLVTNGLLLAKGSAGEVWAALREYSISAVVTSYPIRFDYGLLEAKAKAENVPIYISGEIRTPGNHRKRQHRQTILLAGNAPKHGFTGCGYLNACNVLRDGKWYICPKAAHIETFNKHFSRDIARVAADYVDIYKAGSWRELAEYSSNRIPLCDYCDVPNWQANYKEWQPSGKTIEEYVGKGS